MSAATDCGSCIDSLFVEISHDSGANWEELPAIKRVNKTFQDNQAQTIRHSNTGKKFVSQCGGADSRTEQYSVDHYPCDENPIEWYLRGGDEVWWRVHKERAAGTNKMEVFRGKYIDGGYDWDNGTEDQEVRTFTIELTSSVARARYDATGVTPNSNILYTAKHGPFWGVYADATAINAIENEVAGDSAWNVATETFWTTNGTTWSDTSSDAAP